MALEMTKDEALRELSLHLMQCGALMPIDWLTSHGDGSRFMTAYKMAMDALREQEGKDTDVRTNADRIRTLTDDELVDRFFAMYRGQMEADVEDLSCVWCDGNSGCVNEDGEVDCNEEMHKDCIRRWLQAPAKEEPA